MGSQSTVGGGFETGPSSRPQPSWWHEPPVPGSEQSCDYANMLFLLIALATNFDTYWWTLHATVDNVVSWWHFVLSCFVATPLGVNALPHNHKTSLHKALDGWILPSS
jgi:hypothetical protein